MLPNGDAETNAPDRPLELQGIRAFLVRVAMPQASAGPPSAECITFLRDSDGGDGVAETRTERRR